jgi:hypothetical protein
MKLPFPVFTRICEPFVRLGYEVKNGHVKRDMYEPTRNDTVVMIDIGLRTAKVGGAPVTIDYIKYVRHYANRYVTLFVIPDSWCTKMHVENAMKFIKLASKLGNVDNMVPIFVAHYYLLKIEKYMEILEKLQELFPIVLVGITGNLVTSSTSTVIKCAKRPNLCNHYVEIAVKDAYARGFKVHVLGITKPTLNYLVRRGIYGIVSSDTDKPRGSGRPRLAHRREYCQVFREWLGDYEQPEPEEWLNEVVE